MLSQDRIQLLHKPPDAPPRGFLYLCEDGTWEIMPPEGGEFQVIDCENPTVFPLAGGRMTGHRIDDFI